jgi:uncharacterized protein YabE (DUF348 family)
VWLPILDITGQLEALDITAEIEHLDLEAHRADFAAELKALQANFWNTAARRLEEAVALVTPVPQPALLGETSALASPVTVPGPVAPAPYAPEVATPRITAPGTAPALAPQPAAEPVGLRDRLRLAIQGTDLRTRLVGGVLVLGVIGALATVFPSVVGASVPQRYVTITLDGRTVARTVRASTVAEVLALEGITLRPEDRVIPAPGTELREGMHVRVLRAFPVDVDIDGTMTTIRTTSRSEGGLRRELGINPSLVVAGSDRVAAGTTVAFRTPHDVTLQVDGATIAAPRSTALDVAALLAEHNIPLGPRDEVMPAANTRLADGLQVKVFRLADNQVADRLIVPFITEVRDDPNLPAGQTRMIQVGTPGIRRDIFVVTTRSDGAVIARNRIGSELLVPPVSQVVVKGTQPLGAFASGSATWYGTGPGPGTCAHLSLKFGTIVTLTNQDTGSTATCRVADRGPESWTGHIIDLSPDVFRRLAPLSQGVIPNIALSS